LNAGPGLTRLPPGFPAPTYWHVATETTDAGEAFEAYLADYRRWLSRHK
jgi:hypothetical protein